MVKNPPDISWEEAAATWMSFTTAWLVLVHHARVGKGDYTIIDAASSSVGLSAIQIARRSGAVPIALTRTPSKAKALEEAGARGVIVTSKEDAQQVVLKLTDGQGARVIFDAVGGKEFSSLVAAAAAEGIILVYGALGKEANTFSAIQVIRRRLIVRGVASTGGILADDIELASLKTYVLGGLRTGELRPKIAKTFPFDEIAEAHRFIEAGDQFGRVVLTV